MTRNRWIALGAVLALLFGAAGCGTESHSSGGEQHGGGQGQEAPGPGEGIQEPH